MVNPDPPKARRASIRGGKALARAVNAHATGDREAAERAYAEAAGAGDPAAAFQLGVMRHERGDFVGAVRAYEQAAAEGDMEALLNLANLLADRLARPDEARSLYREAVERGDLRAMFDLGYFLWREGDHAGAETAFRQAAEAGDPRGHLELGLLLADVGRDRDALPALTQAAALGLTEALTHLGWQLARLGEPEEAERVLRHAFEAGELASAPLLFHVLNALGRREEAAALLAESSQLARDRVSLDYRDLLGSLDGEDVGTAEVEEWSSAEGLDSRFALELRALVFDASRLAQAETRLALASAHGDQTASAMLAALRDKIGRPDESPSTRD